MPGHYAHGLPTSLYGPGGPFSLIPASKTGVGGPRPSKTSVSSKVPGGGSGSNTLNGGLPWNVYKGSSDLGAPRYGEKVGGIGPVLQGVGLAACAGLDPTWAAACTQVVNYVTSSSSPVAADPKCPEGTFRVPGSDVCVNPGHFLPGGQPLTMSAGGVAVTGSFGIPALTPHIVGEIMDKDGKISLIRRCNRGSVLGLDDLCYAKQILPRRNKFRKHRGAKRPPMTAADATALGRIGTLREKVKTLAKDANMSCKLK